MALQVSTRAWLVRMAGMILALAGILWLMKSLQSPSAAVTDPNSAVGALLGVEPSSENIGIPAKVKTK